MASLNVSYEALREAERKIETEKTEILDKLNALGAHISELTSEGFVTQQTSGAFNDAFERFNQGAKTTITALEDVSAFLKKVEQTLQETDQQLASALG